MTPARGARRVVGLLLAALAILAGCAADAPVGVGPDGLRTCGLGNAALLTAQSVPSAAYVPCVDDGLDEWSVQSADHASSGTDLQLETDGGGGSWRIGFRRTCDVSSLEPVTDADPVQGYDGEVYGMLDRSGGRHRETLAYRFDGGCVTSVVDLPDRAALDVWLTERDEGLELLPRAELDREVQRRTDGELQLDP